jgi:hypothetical protein
MAELVVVAEVKQLLLIQVKSGILDLMIKRYLARKLILLLLFSF